MLHVMEYLLYSSLDIFSFPFSYFPQDSDEQRDSAVSCTSVDSELQGGDSQRQHLSSSPLPHPFIYTHSLDNIQYPTILNRLREVLIISRQKMVAGDKNFTQSLEEASPSYRKSMSVEVRTLKPAPSSSGNGLANCPSSSRTSLDSTGSSSINDTASAMSEVGVVMAAPATADERRDDNSTSSCSYVNGGTSGGNHMVNGVNGHSESPPIGEGSSPPCAESNSGRISAGSGSVSSSNSRERPTSLQGLDEKSSDVASKLSMDTTPSVDKVSLASSESGSTSEVIFTPPSPSLAQMRGVTAASPVGRPPIGRRQTCPTGMQHVRNSALMKSTGGNNFSSSFTSGSSPSNTKRYTNVSSAMTARPQSASMQKGVKLRRNTSRVSMTIPKKTRKRPSNQPAVGNPAIKIVKVVLAGNDFLVSHAAKAYAYLQVEEPNLLSGMELRFYHVPLSRASVIHSRYPDLAYATNLMGNSGSYLLGELPEPMFEQIDFSGNDVHLGRFLSHMDSWYERNLMMAVHHLLRLIPSVSGVGGVCWWVGFGVEWNGGRKNSMGNCFVVWDKWHGLKACVGEIQRCHWLFGFVNVVGRYRRQRIFFKDLNFIYVQFLSSWNGACVASFCAIPIK